MTPEQEHPLQQENSLVFCYGTNSSIDVDLKVNNTPLRMGLVTGSGCDPDL